MPIKTAAEAERQLAAVTRHLDKLTYAQTRQFVKRRMSEYPRFLYKFRRLSNDEETKQLRQIIVHSELWLSSAAKFNDPFDMRAKITFDATGPEWRERFKRLLKSQGKKHHEIERELKVMMTGNRAEKKARAAETFLQTMFAAGVCSFAGDPRSILMWSHYGHHHEGVCLVFEIARDPKTFLNALNVKYTQEYPFINWVKSPDRPDAIKSAILSKHEGWNYEKESRIVVPEKANTPLKFRAEALRAVIVGCCATPEAWRNLKTVLNERETLRMPRIHIYESVRDEERYDLHIFKSKKWQALRRGGNNERKHLGVEKS